MPETRDLNSAPGRRRRPALVDACIQVDPQLQASRTARHWVMSTLGDAGVGGAANQVVELLAAELVGQALLRTPEKVEVRVRYDGVVVRVEVVDDAEDTSDPSAPVLAILGALAAAWGVLPGLEGRGRTVWVEVETEDEEWWG
ncbi:MAG: ATP-binding protein [Micrococcales bacterium]|nr:ATP-binding protein [Micrococcales bacterium]